MEKALIAMSGGVDSSVAALLTGKLGYECVGCTMRLFDNADAALPESRVCCSLEDAEDARDVACRLGMPYYVFNLRDVFREKVIDKFVDCYQRGLTPNPCIDCNRYLKFGALHERARILGCEYVVTGHYARIERRDGRFVLKTALDPERDQSYVLYCLTQEQLAHTLFPLGTLRKSEVRRIAAEHGFLNAAKRDSQDICFVPDGDYAAAIQRFSGLPAVPGDFVSADGAVLGRHRGIIHYTVGQRRGLGVSAAQPLYVLAVRPEDNTVVLGVREELFRRDAEAGEFNWIAGEPPDRELRCAVKIRYRQSAQAARVIPVGPDRVRILFDEPQRAVTPGQSAVLYDGDVVLGGGVLL